MYLDEIKLKRVIEYRDELISAANEIASPESQFPQYLLPYPRLEWVFGLEHDGEKQDDCYQKLVELLGFSYKPELIDTALNFLFYSSAQIDEDIGSDLLGLDMGDFVESHEDLAHYNIKICIEYAKELFFSCLKDHLHYLCSDLSSTPPRCGSFSSVPVPAQCPSISSCLKYLNLLLKGSPFYKEMSASEALLRSDTFERQVIDFVKQILAPEFHGPLQEGNTESYYESTYHRLVSHPTNFNHYASGYDLKALLFTLYIYGQTDYELFRSLYKSHPCACSEFSIMPDSRNYEHGDSWDMKLRSEFEFQFSRYASDLFEEIKHSAEEPGNKEYILSHSTFGKIDHLVAGCRILSTYGNFEVARKNLGFSCSNHLENMFKVTEDLHYSNHQEMVDSLRGFDQALLLSILNKSLKAKEIVLKALDWQDLLPLLRYMENYPRPNEDSIHNYRDDIICNCADPKNGVITSRQLDHLVADIPEKRLKLFLKSMAEKGSEYREMCYLIESYCDFNRKKVLKAIDKRNQTAIKAYGLLPLPKDLDLKRNELLDRYNSLLEFKKGTKKYGAERKANETAAAEVALTNLAYRAGYTDHVQLEWEMESIISQNASENILLVDEYRVRLELKGLKLAFQTEKDGKTLKSVPAKLKKDQRFNQFKENSERIQNQIRRFRSTFEEMMRRQDMLETRELEKLLSIDACRYLLNSLVLQQTDEKDNRQTYGLIDLEKNKLIDKDENEYDLQGQFRICHPLDLLKEDILSDWQKRVIGKQVTQPFKQIFREIYIKTAAEIETFDHSRRFIGFEVASHVAAGIFANRGWDMNFNQENIPNKTFWNSNIRAFFYFDGISYFFGGSDNVVSGKIYFEDLSGEAIPLEVVPEHYFSETMRDCDLIVSVAQTGRISTGEPYHSQVFAENRLRIIESLMKTLKLRNIKFIDENIHIIGKLANYRISAKSGAVYIDPGKHVCIIEASEKIDHLYLPFANDDDRILSQILSKILLLSNDEKIKDPIILEQIEPHRK